MSTLAETLHSPAQPRVSTRVAATLEHVSGAQWDDAIAGFDGVSQEQLFAFAHARWPHIGLEPVLISLNDELIGGCLMMIQRLPLGLASIAIAKWGPFLKDVSGDAMGRYATMIDALAEEYATRRRMMLSLLPLPAIGERNAEFEHLIARGFHKGAQMDWADRYIVRLGLSAEEQRKSFGQTWRRQLGKAEKAGLSFEVAGPERLGEFDAMYERMVDRKGFEDRSAYWDTVPALMAMANETLRPKLFFVRHDGEVIAGAIIFTAGERAVYLYGATRDAALPLRAGYFLHWHIIGWLGENAPEAAWYDLGGTDGFQGLHQFKKGMVGERGIITKVPPTANFAAYRLPFLLGEAAFAARDAVQKFKARLRERKRAPEATES
jgi:hypothetical protein